MDGIWRCCAILAKAEPQKLWWQENNFVVRELMEIVNSYDELKVLLIVICQLFSCIYGLVVSLLWVFWWMYLETGVCLTPRWVRNVLRVYLFPWIIYFLVISIPSQRGWWSYQILIFISLGSMIGIFRFEKTILKGQRMVRWLVHWSCIIPDHTLLGPGMCRKISLRWYMRSCLFVCVRIRGDAFTETFLFCS